MITNHWLKIISVLRICLFCVYIYWRIMFYRDDPQSTGRITPVMDALFSEAKKWTAFTMSSIWGNFLSGEIASMWSKTLSNVSPAPLFAWKPVRTPVGLKYKIIHNFIIYFTINTTFINKLNNLTLIINKFIIISD